MDCIVQSKIFDYDENERILKEMKKEYPFLVCHTVGESVCGRKIYGLSLGNYKNIVLFAGGFHGQEWLTCLLLYKYIENICYALKHKKKIAGVNIASSLVSKGITVIPCVNPDGVEIALHGAIGAGEYASYVELISKGDYSQWNANAKGIDINHNFNAGWEILHQMEIENGIFGPSPRQYGGFAPESEPETAAMVKFCERNNVHHAFALHSQGEEIYWNYEDLAPQNSRTVAKILSVCSGYKLVSNDSLASHGGFKDWFIENFRRSAFTIEIGKGKNPLPVEMLDLIYEKVEEMLVVGTII